MNNPERVWERHEFYDYKNVLEISDMWAMLKRENQQSSGSAGVFRPTACITRFLPEALMHGYHFTLSSKAQLYTNFTWKKLIIFESLPLGFGLGTTICRTKAFRRELKAQAT
jgi:hypothetical protein